MFYYKNTLMLDPNRIRKNPDEVKTALKNRGLSVKLVDDFLLIDGEWRAANVEVDKLRAGQKRLSSPLIVEEARKNKETLRPKEKELAALAAKRGALLEEFPNIPFSDVPVGKSEKDNKVIREKGARPQFSFKPREYMEVDAAKKMIDTERASKVSGSRFGYLVGDAVLLEFALVRLAFEKLVSNGFIPVIPPVMIRPEAYKGMGRLAGDQKEERYYLEKDDIYLVGSSEHTLGPLHMGEVLDEKTLPRRYAGFSTCFRREAGSYGKDTKGILRVHQFDKVEMFSFAKPEDSDNEHKFLLSCQEELMNELELPYRVVEICTGDMGWTDARQYDIEVWLPGQNQYRESHSCSNTTDFQARGISARYKETRDKRQETSYLHMLNATALAIGRILIAIIENYQTEKSAIKVPKALQSYVGKEEIS
ncbi:MAG: Serine-tRNA ligase [Parcubacteria group bacterium GW2011_GWB1_45_9]|nr:MAG: Serine-tRNA ligase [Parcubacteria group bacterium GW2011_GWB1_45_9]